MKKLILLAVVLTTLSSVSFAQTTSAATVKKIEVTGSAEMEVVPDEIYISITLQEYYNKQKEKVNIDEISKSFLSACQNAGIAKDRIEVQEMSGFDNSDWWYRRKKKEQPDLMQATAYVVKFSSPAEVDKLINIIDDKATQNVSISKVSNSKQTEYRKQLKTQALQNAKAKAQYLLEGIGEKIGGVIYVREIESEPVLYTRYAQTNSMAFSNSVASGGDVSANEGLNFKKIKYRYEMEAHFAIQ